MKLQIAENLVLGAELIVSTIGIFATKGQGKSHLAQVMAEEMLSQGQVIVAIDPTDAWHGLRSSADGKHEGYPVVVFGGDHGDLPLDAGGGIQLAEAVVTERFSCVICTDGMTDMAETKFVREFLDTIYRRNREPIHIFVDEADVFAPQKPFDVEDARCIRAMSHIVRRGRKKGIGSTLITQRPAELNASVRTMVDMLFVLGMSHNLDIDAVEKWLRLRKKKRGNNAAFALQEEMIESLDSLQQGDAWVWAPRLKIHKRFRARAKRTFDSGATPKAGQKSKVPKKLAPVDLQRLGQALTASIERAKANDPTHLRSEVARLKAELARRPAVGIAEAADGAKWKAAYEELRADRSKVTAGDHARLEKIVARAEAALTQYAATQEGRHATHVEAFKKLAATHAETIARFAETVEAQALTCGRAASGRVTEVLSEMKTVIDGLRAKIRPATPSVPAAAPRALSPLPSRALSSPRPAANGHRVNGSTATVATVVEGVKLEPADLRFLGAIAWWNSIGVEAPTFRAITFVAEVSSKSSSVENRRSKLHTAGLIEYRAGKTIALTAAGAKAAPTPDADTSLAALHAKVKTQLEPADVRMLDVLIAAYPDAVTYDELAERSGSSTSSSSFENRRSAMRSLGLAEYPAPKHVRAAPLLFPEGLA